MTDDVLKPALVLKVLENKILLSDSQQINVLMRDFLEVVKQDGLKINEVATLLSRFQRRKLIKVIEIFTAREAETVAVLDIASLVGTTIHKNYDLGELEANLYSERTGFVCQINSDFCDYLQKFLADNKEAETVLTFNPKLQEILLPLENILKLDVIFQEKPFIWHCPVDRSKVGEIKSKEDVERYLKDFAQGKYPSCLDRRHKNKFWVTDKTISFGTLPLAFEDIFAAKQQEVKKPAA